jgi:hypothetical protein
MTKIKGFLYTFIDEESGELDDIVAPNEQTARLHLGDDWIDASRCPLFSPPVDVGKWDSVVWDAHVDAGSAFDAMNAARPMSGSTTSPEALNAFNEATANHARKKARLTRLLKMSADVP